MLYSLFHMKITVSVAKSSHQDHDIADAIYTSLFFSYTCTLFSPGKKKFVVIAVFVSKLDCRPLFNGIYYKISQVRGLAPI